MSDEPVQARKAQLREAARRVLVEDIESANTRVLAELHKLRSWHTDEWVALYAAADHEVDVRPFFDGLRARGIHCALPRVAGDELNLHEVTSWHELETGSFGLLEPPAGARPVVSATIAVFVLPGLLFDRRGHRLGRGGGHYDRLLAQADSAAFRIGLCHAERLIGEIPVAAWDISVDCVVTDREVIRVEGT